MQRVFFKRPSHQFIACLFNFICLAILLEGCDNRAQQKQSEFPRENTLYIAGFQWSEPATFNPMDDWPAWPITENFNLVYETLLAYNSLNGHMEPLLADSFGVETDHVWITLNPLAKWSNGNPVSNKDVFYTFELGQQYPLFPTSAAWDYISKIDIDSTHTGSSRVRFFIQPQRKNPLVVLDVLQDTKIISESVYTKLIDSLGGDITKVKALTMSQNPVVSGPYTLHSSSSEKVVLKRRDNYWGNAAYHHGKLPAPQWIIHPILRTNDHYSIGLQKGKIDFSATFIPRIWLKEKKQVHAWYPKEPFFIPASIPMLMINHQKPSLSDVNLRRAMAFAINDRDIRELAVSGYSAPLKAGIILPEGIESRFFDSSDAHTYGTFFNLDSAKKILKSAGYTSIWDAKGNLQSMTHHGTVVPTITIASPAGWSDWESIVRVAVRSMREVGIDVREHFIDPGLYWQNLPIGDWDMLLYTPAPNAMPSQPWARFETIMTTKGYAPLGEKMTKNPGRFNNPKSASYIYSIDSLIDLIPNLRDSVQLVLAYRKLNQFFMTQLPSIPLVYRPEQFFQYSTRHWTGFPNSENPYAPPQGLCFGAGTRALWQLKPTAVVK